MQENMMKNVGKYVSQFAEEYINKYRTFPNTYDCSIDAIPAYWTGGNDGSGTFHVCCSTFVQYMFNKALGVDISNDLGINLLCDYRYSDTKKYIVIRKVSDLKPGDILTRDRNGYHSGHMELYIGNNKIANGGSGVENNNLEIGEFSSDLSHWPIDKDGGMAVALRLTENVEVNPSGKITGTGIQNGKKINYSEFFFNGIPDGTYSLASKKTIFDLIIDAISSLLNFFTGLLTYLFRGVIISFISIFDRFINNTVYSLENSPKSLEESGISATSADDPSGTNRSVTIEGIIFNNIDLFDINIFK